MPATARSALFEHRAPRIGLSPSRRALLEALRAGKGEIVSIDDLILRIWGINDAGSQNHLAVLVRKLRIWLAANSPLERIVTARGAGYRLVPASWRRGVDIEGGRCGASGRIYALLSARPGHVVAYAALEAALETGGASDGRAARNYLKVKINQLRRAMRLRRDPYRIKTVWGTGYLLVPAEEGTDQ